MKILAILGVLCALPVLSRPPLRMSMNGGQAAPKVWRTHWKRPQANTA